MPGVPSSITTAVLSVRPRGAVINVAIWENEIPVNPNIFVLGEKSYHAGQLSSKTPNNCTISVTFLSQFSHTFQKTSEALLMPWKIKYCSRTK
jgi:threonine dehydrogenase-like Zn-dependent dehydrogenase